MTWVLVPLGNPGDQYVKTRHNLGRYLLDHWIQQKGSLTLIKKYTHGSLWKLSSNINIYESLGSMRQRNGPLWSKFERTYRPS